MREDAFNEVLAEELRRRRRYWEDNPETIACQRLRLVEDTREQIDILVQSPDSYPVAVEAEWRDPALADARGRLGKRIVGAPYPVRSAIAVGLPEEARGWTRPRLEREFATPENVPLRFVVLYSNIRGDEPAGKPLLESDVLRWPARGFVTGDVDDLARLCEYATAPPGLVSSMAREVGMRITGIAADLRGRTRARTVESIVHSLGQEDLDQGLRLACCIWLTSLRLQNRLAEQSDALAEAGLRSVADVRDAALGGRVNRDAIRAEWGKILSVNYGAIFSSALTSLHPGIPDAQAGDALTALGELAGEIASARLGNRVDFAGELFPELLADREETAAHYTLPVTAELLAGLAVDRLAVDDWAGTDALRGLRIADLACGTGALLRAAYGHIRHRHESAGGRVDDLHKALMEECLTGIDINALAAHMTASGLSSSGIATEYSRSNIAAVSVIEGQTGSLELLVGEQLTNMLGGTSFDAAANGGQPATITVADGSQDLVIQNPPYSRARGDRKLFAVAGIDEGARERSIKRLGAIRGRLRRKGDEMIDGQAGLASDFSALADLKLKPHGVFATVLPLTAAHAESWTGFRKTIERKYDDIMAIAFTGHEEEMMSAETNIREMLLIAGKRPNGEPANVLCVNLSAPPRTLAEAFWYRRLIAKSIDPRRNADVIALGGVIGSWVRAASPEPGFPWFAVGMRNHDLATVATRLLAGELYSPQDRTGWSLGVPPTTLGQTVGIGPTHHLIGRVRDDDDPKPFTTLGRVVQIGPTHDVIGHLRGKDDRGAFTFDPVDDDIPTYPALWAASAKTQRRLTVAPTHAGRPVNGDGDDQARAMLAQRGDLFISRTLRMTSQALAAARTEQPMIGGRAWTALIGDDEPVKAALAIWLNSTPGLVLRTCYAQTTQPGRATMQIKALAGFPVPDFGAATAAGERARSVARERLAELSALELRPIACASVDGNRKRIDEVALEMVGLSDEPDAARALDFLRAIWCREPAVHGGNRAIMRELGL